MAYTSAVTGGVTQEYPYGQANGAFRRFAIIEQVRPSSGDYYEPLVQTLPANSRIIQVGLYNIDGLSYTGNDATGTANLYALVASTASSPATGSTQGTAAWQQIIAISGTNTSAFTQAVQQMQIPYYNISTVLTTQAANAWKYTASQYLFIMPAHIYTNTSAYPFSVQTDTTGYKFVATATATNTYRVAISVLYETYADPGT